MTEQPTESWRALGYCERTMDEAVAQWEESVARWRLCPVPPAPTHKHECYVHKLSRPCPICSALG